MNNVAVLGIGNLLMGDEGFGVHVIRHLEQAYAFPDEVQLHDTGTAAIYLAPVLEASNWVMVVDVIKSDKQPGTLEFLNGSINPKNIQSSMSPHQIGILEIIDICRLRGKAPEKVEFLCVVPRKIAPGIELTDTLKPCVAEIGREIVTRLKKKGYNISYA